MQVLIWSENFWPHIGGIEVLATQLLVVLQQRGYEFIVVTRMEGPIELPSEASYRGIPVYRFPFWTALTDGMDGLMEARAQVVKLKRTFAPDLVHVHSLGPSVFFQLSTHAAHPAPLLVTLHGGWGSTALRASKQRNGRHACDTLLGQTLHAADWVTGVSAATLAEVLALMPQLTSRSSVIHNGLTAPAHAPGPLPIDPPRLLCLGRLAPEKGFDVALTAFASIAARFPAAKMIVAGDGPSRTELGRQAADLALSGRVDFVGWVAPDQVPALINDATLVVLPSRHESFGLVALEAALMARPVVASRVEGLPEVVVSEETGLLVETEDCAGLAAAMAFLLEHPDTAAAMGRAARRRAQVDFSLQSCADAYDALYQKLNKEVSHARSA